MAIKRIISIVAIFIVLMAFTVAPALAFFYNPQIVQITLQTNATKNSTTNSTTNATSTSSDPAVSPVPRTPAAPTPTISTVAASQFQNSSEVAASSTEKSQLCVSPTNATNASMGAKELSADLENCSAPLSQPASLLSASQTCLLYTPSFQVPTVSSSAFPEASAISAEATALSAEGTALSQNGSVSSMTLPGVQTGTAASFSAQSVFEFSLLGLGAPALLVGVLYLLLRRV